MNMLQTIEQRIKQYEEEILKVVANHTALTGALNELKTLLSVAEKVADVVAPSVAPEIGMVEEVVSAVDESLNKNAPVASNDVIDV